MNRFIKLNIGIMIIGFCALNCQAKPQWKSQYLLSNVASLDNTINNYKIALLYPESGVPMYLPTYAPVYSPIYTPPVYIPNMYMPPMYLTPMYTNPMPKYNNYASSCSNDCDIAWINCHKAYLSAPNYGNDSGYVDRQSAHLAQCDIERSNCKSRCFHY